MSSIKCPNCGLTNFASATECKRCQKELPEAGSYAYWPPKPGDQPPKPDWSKSQTATAGTAEIVNLDDYGDGRHPLGNILFAIYLGLTIVSTLGTLLFLHFVTTPEVWRMVTDPNTGHYLPTLEPLFYFAWLAAIVFLFGAVLLLMKLCRKSSAFLSLVPVYLMAQFSYFVLEGCAVYRLAGEIRERHFPALEPTVDQLQWCPFVSLIGILITFIWFRYFSTSKRARLVFE